MHKNKKKSQIKKKLRRIKAKNIANQIKIQSLKKTSKS
jgi:hypothetical protein